MQELQRKILALIQDDFPIQPEPYSVLADKIGVTEEDIINALAELKKDGVIRRLGAIFDSRRLGYYSTLCAMSVPKDRVESVAAIINSFSGVTHNYLREHRYNMWFTLIAPNEQSLQAALVDIYHRTGIEVKNLPAERFFKVKVKFSLDEKGDGND